MAGYDLHVHSDWSDGRCSVARLAREARAAGLSGFALTDHDTVDGWSELPACAAAHGVEILPGLELSTEWQERDVHILVYGLAELNAELRDLLAFLRRSRFDRIHKMIKNLAALGVVLDEQAVFARAGRGVPGRPHIGRLLIEQGHAASMQEVFERYLGRDCPAYEPRAKLAPDTAIRIAAAAGGLPVLAHPALDNAIELLPSLLAAGLRGLEVYHPRNDREQTQTFASLAWQHGLIVTGGSDYHGFHDAAHAAIGDVRLKELPAALRG